MTGEDDVAASRVARILAAAPGVACTILQRPGTRPVFTYASARLIDVYGCAPQELERDEDLLNGLLGLPGELALTGWLGRQRRVHIGGNALPCVIARAPN